MKFSPKTSKKPSTFTKFEKRLIGTLFGLAYTGLVLISVFWVMLICINYSKVIHRVKILVKPPTKDIISQALPKFDSCQALQDKLKEGEYRGYYDIEMLADFAMPLASKAGMGAGEAKAPDYSQTNIQVAGVDEADIVKTDGRYIYTLSNNDITISLAYPPNQAQLLSKTEIDGNPQEIFIDDNNLLIFGQRSFHYPAPLEKKTSAGIAREEIWPPPYYSNITFVEIYNLSNPNSPVLKRKVEFEGNYLSSRKIGKYVYFVLNSYPDYIIFEQDEPSIGIVPLYRDLSGEEVDDIDKELEGLVECSDVFYIDPIQTSQYLTVIGLPIDNYTQPVTKKVILGASQDIYASLENLYVANTEYIYEPKGVFSIIEPARSYEVTNVYKFSLAKDEIEYLGEGTVLGRILNQFSMDEHKGYFRIATTIGNVSRSGGGSSNNIYVLDKDLKIVGSIEDIAPGEQIYSARFMGDKGYLVTFKKVDPFFTIDLTIPTAPKILGKLKIPGYSDYLHPYDENHIIGIGKETVEAEEGDFAWYQGLKMALFDVSDFTNPREVGKVVIGDRGTDSPILYDHKALLFSQERNLLVIPITLAELSPEQKADVNRRTNAYGDYVYQGSYVFEVSPQIGFNLRGRVTHYSDDEVFKKSGYYYYGGNLEIKRNLYIDNSLYSVSDGKIMIHDLKSLNEQGEIDLGAPEGVEIEPIMF